MERVVQRLLARKSHLTSCRRITSFQSTQPSNSHCLNCSGQRAILCPLKPRHNHDNAIKASSFHSQCVHYKRYKKGITVFIDETIDLENQNWNVKSDIGLDSVYEGMRQELENMGKVTHDASRNEVQEETGQITDQHSCTSHQPVLMDRILEEVIGQVQITSEEEKPKWKSPVELKRGSDGVFDVEEIVEVLRSENARDICVIQLPEMFHLADYMVIVSGVSTRHCKAIGKAVQWIYKRKKSSKDPNLAVDGLKSTDWLAYDLGNIFLHVFLPETRELYDLESLWSVGEKFDERSQVTADKQTDLDWLTQLSSELPYNTSSNDIENKVM